MLECLQRPSEVCVAGVFGRDTKREFFTAAGDPDRDVGVLEGFGLADRALERVVLAPVGHLVFGPHAAHDLDAFTQHPEAGRSLGELVAVTVVLVVVPAGSDPHLDAPS